MLLKMGVRICPSFWYQMDFFRVLAHGLEAVVRYVLNFILENTKGHVEIARNPFQELILHERSNFPTFSF